MNYIRIFDEVVNIMHNDYSGCFDKRGWDNPDFFRGRLNFLIDKKRINKCKFHDLLQEYLLAFKDYHISFNVKGLKRKAYAVDVRRYKDNLYITESDNPDFKKGDIIIKLGNNSILKAREKYKDYFFEGEAERESWNNILHKYKACDVLSPSGDLYKRDLKHIPDYNYGEKLHYIAKKINENTLYIKLPHFCDDGKMKGLINDNVTHLENCKNLIVDVRTNIGGSDVNYFPLLKYILPNGINLSSLSPESGEMKINYTVRNCEGRIALMSEYLKKAAGESTKKHLLAVIDDLRQKSGKGFLSVEHEEGDKDLFNITGQGIPQNVIILSDFDCGSSGDAFVEICKMSSKVTVIGRPTMGITDYSNINTIDLDGLTLYYPTSRDDSIDKGKGLNDKGVQPHIYIPWTPTHLEKDVDLEFALNHLNQE